MSREDGRGREGLEGRSVLVIMGLLVAAVIGVSGAVDSAGKEIDQPRKVDRLDLAATGGPDWRWFTYGCTYTIGYWKTHEEAWPVTWMMIGGQGYDQAELLEILWSSVKKDLTLVLAHQLIGAKLNVSNGADPTVVRDVMLAADQFLSLYPLGTPVDPGDRELMSQLADKLDRFNMGVIGPGHCDDSIPATETPTPFATPTSTPSPTVTPTALPTAPFECPLDPDAFSAGKILSTEFEGVTISVVNNRPGHPDLAIVFDTSNPTGGDFDLGTPNQAFGGPGIGSGGGPGQPGENSEALGNVIVIAENDVDRKRDGFVDSPDDEGAGGEVEFMS